MYQPRRSHRRPRYRALQNSMADVRSGAVVFVSHCLLNQNTRYLGGAVCPGAVIAAVTPYLEDGTGVVQMPCPEQRVLGGVLKTRMLWLIEHPRLARSAPVVQRAVVWYLRRRYARQARALAREVGDYLGNGLSVRGIVGVSGSPSCGVHTTMDLTRAAAAVACRREPATADWMNAAVVEPALRPGPGLFVEELTRALGCRGVPADQAPLLEAVLPSLSSSGHLCGEWSPIADHSPRK
jgi:predicted secreted protein